VSYESIDKLQRAMAAEVFGHSKDSKKAAGRALGTILESLTYFVLRGWGLRDSIAIEQRLPEFGNPEITHNVEFSLHPNRRSIEVVLPGEISQAWTTTRVIRQSESLQEFLSGWELQPRTLIGADGVQNNCVILHQSERGIVTAQIEQRNGGLNLRVNEIETAPYAMVECKRVGVEDGQKKGPTTIEKAKQGAYVAQSLSSIYRVGRPDGPPLAVYWIDGKPTIGDYDDLMATLIESGTKSSMDGMVITIGVVSNHGNWFTGEYLNKELKVLRGAYDWLLFLKDEAMATFISETLLDPEPEFAPIKQAFLSTYTADRKGKNRFTKKTMDRHAYLAMAHYFESKKSTIEASWFEVLSEGHGSLQGLRDQLQVLDRRIQALHDDNAP
jgi:hypothetical protein